MKILIINGPNLNLIGRREPEVYGTLSFEEYLDSLKKLYPTHDIKYFQTNSEGGIIDKLHEVGFDDYCIILNAGGYSHSSVAILDAIKSIKSPVVEVHISNIFAREEFRHKSLLSQSCSGVIVGCGLDGYRLAVDFFTHRTNI